MGLFKSIKRAVSKTFDFVGDLVGDVIGWLMPEPEIPDFGQDFSDENNRGALVNKFNANAHIPVVYGTRKVGGNVVFLETSGTDNQYLYMALVLSEGEVADIDAIFINDNQVTWSGDIADNTQITVASSDANFYSGSSLITCEPHFGSDSQTASSLLSTLSSWTSNHRLRGLCYLAIRFEWNQDKFGSLPTVQAVVKGKKVYNPNLEKMIVLLGNILITLFYNYLIIYETKDLEWVLLTVILIVTLQIGKLLQMFVMQILPLIVEQVR